jgi:hypothetical protein
MRICDVREKMQVMVNVSINGIPNFGEDTIEGEVVCTEKFDDFPDCCNVLVLVKIPSRNGYMHSAGGLTGPEERNLWWCSPEGLEAKL